MFRDEGYEDEKIERTIRRLLWGYPELRSLFENEVKDKLSPARTKSVEANALVRKSLELDAERTRKV